MSLDDIFKYYVRLPIPHMNYLLTTNFKNDSTWIESLFQTLDKAQQTNKFLQEYEKAESYSFLKEIIWIYIKSRSISDVETAEYFMFLIMCVADVASSPI